MGRSFDPNSFAHELPTLHRQWTQSVDKQLNGGVDMGTPKKNALASAGVNAGVYTQFDKGNSSGVLFRIAATGNSDQNAPYNWAGVSTGVVIFHGLKRKPIGFHVVDSDGQIQVYRTAPPDDQQITLAPSDDTISVTVYIF